MLIISIQIKALKVIYYRMGNLLLIEVNEVNDLYIYGAKLDPWPTARVELAHYDSWDFWLCGTRLVDEHFESIVTHAAYSFCLQWKG